MNRFFVILLGFLVLCLASFEAKAYSFSAKVINETGHDLSTVRTMYRAKGAKNSKNCWTRMPLEAGASHQSKCARTNQNVEKWQRQILVDFRCPGQGERQISFPRNAKFYKRDHATKNGDRYTVKIKASDC